MSELNFAKTFLQTLDAKPTKYPSNHVFDPKTFATRIPVCMSHVFPPTTSLEICTLLLTPVLAIKFTLPRLPQPPHPPYPRSTPTAAPPPGAAPTHPLISLTLKSSRNPSLALTLHDINPSVTLISRLREAVQSELGGPTVVPAEKIKILYNKKPIPTSKKTVGDALEEQGLEHGKLAEMGVMVLGGAPDPPAALGAANGRGDTAPPGLGGVAVATNSPHGEQMEGIAKMSSPPPVQGPSGREILRSDEFWTDLQGYLEQRIKDEAESVRLVQKWKSNWDTY